MGASLILVQACLLEGFIGMTDDELDDSALTYRGDRLNSGEFVSSLAYEYRAEVHRLNASRARLDVTTNWAVVVTSISISIAFSHDRWINVPG